MITTIRYRAINKDFFDLLSKKYISSYFICYYTRNEPELLVPSVFSGFIIKYSNTYNSRRNLANCVVPFLNYVIERTLENIPLYLELMKDGLASLSLYHLADYLNFISNDPENPITRTTVLQKEKVLLNLYYYMSETQVCNKNDIYLNKAKQINLSFTGTKHKRVSPFYFCPDIYLQYPPQNYKKKKVLKDMKEEVWDLFVEYADEYYQNISFGIILLICSGIRIGECVNLRVKDIHFNKNQQPYINIDDHPELFQNRKINLSNSQVKKPREKQPILPLYSRINVLYEKHLSNLRVFYGTEQINNKALFVNAAGNPMSGQSFRYYFTLLKQEFLRFLCDNGLENIANELYNYKWGAHIGRHIFTNAVVKKGYANGGTNRPIPRLVAILRGDSCEESAVTYIDEQTIATAIQENVNIISETAKEIGER